MHRVKGKLLLDMGILNYQKYQICCHLLLAKDIKIFIWIQNIIELDGPNIQQKGSQYVLTTDHTSICLQNFDAYNNLQISTHNYAG